MKRVILSNADINMQTKEIVADIDEHSIMPVISSTGTPHIFYVSDADFCHKREWNVEEFVFQLVEYCRLRLEMSSGKYTYSAANQPLLTGHSLMGYDWDPLYTWAANLIQTTHPEHVADIHYIDLYPGGSFKITCKTMIY